MCDARVKRMRAKPLAYQASGHDDIGCGALNGLPDPTPPKPDAEGAAGAPNEGVPTIPGAMLGAPNGAPPPKGGGSTAANSLPAMPASY